MKAVRREDESITCIVQSDFQERRFVFAFKNIPDE